MTSLIDVTSYGEELENRLHLKTSPIAMRLLKKGEDIPEGVLRPRRDLGYHLALCQGFALSRRNKETIAMLKEDNWCYLPIIAFGLAEPPDFFLEGNNFFEKHFENLNAAKKAANALPRLEYGKYVGVLSAPLWKTFFKPDVVIIYCDSQQLRRLLFAMKYKEGYLVTSTLDPSGACFQCTIPVIQKGECHVAIPCGGDRNHALAQDDEVIFSLPFSKLETLMAGVRYYDELKRGYGRYAPDMRFEYPLSDLYAKTGRMVGIEIPE